MLRCGTKAPPGGLDPSPFFCPRAATRLLPHWLDSNWWLGVLLETSSRLASALLGPPAPAHAGAKCGTQTGLRCIPAWCFPSCSSEYRQPRCH
ncbi:hypothetical protein AGIG_G3881 [Arapaima gigas]